MFKILTMIIAVIALAGCATRHEGQIAGAAVGAAVGSQMVHPNNSGAGAAIGAALGAVVGGDLSRQREWRPDYRIQPPPPKYHWNPYQVCERYLNRWDRNRCIEDIRASRRH
jgi:hypothetical protein